MKKCDRPKKDEIEEWDDIKNSIMEAADEAIGKKKQE
jgi:hypothetical protein